MRRRELLWPGRAMAEVMAMRFMGPKTGDATSDAGDAESGVALTFMKLRDRTGYGSVRALSSGTGSRRGSFMSPSGVRTGG
jgi:hypothetical protein